MLCYDKKCNLYYAIYQLSIKPMDFLRELFSSDL